VGAGTGATGELGADVFRGIVGAGTGGLGVVGTDSVGDMGADAAIAAGVDTGAVGGVKGAGGAVGPFTPCGGALRVTRTVSLRIGTAEVFVIGWDDPVAFFGFGSSFSLIKLLEVVVIVDVDVVKRRFDALY